MAATRSPTRASSVSRGGQRHERPQREARGPARERRRRSAGGSQDLERPQHPARVGLGALGVGGGSGPQLGHQGAEAARGELGLETRAHVGVGGRRGRQAALERVDVEACAAHHQRTGAAREHLAQRSLGCHGPCGHVHRPVGSHHIDEVVRYLRALGRRRFGGPDVEAAVDLQRVGAHHLEAAPGRRLRQAEHGSGLAAGRGRDQDGYDGPRTAHRATVPQSVPATASPRGRC
jgi:hypothetical protein